jgi:2,4-dienoyl-CoA reductase (NADPH2)
MVLKIRDGRVDEVKPCIGNLTCLARLFSDIPYGCTMNARLGHEVEPEYDITRASQRKRVLVVGAGPAGLEFAVTAAQRGHEVTVYEKRDRAGGQTIAAGREVSGGEAFTAAERYYDTMARKHGVRLVLNTEVTRDLVKSQRPDVVVVATGVRIAAPPFAAGGFPLISALEFMHQGLDATPLGEHIVILSGDRLGLVTAEYLAKTGRHVTIVEEGAKWGKDLGITFKWRHEKWLAELNIRTLLRTSALGLDGGGVRVAGPAGEETIPADAVLYAGPRLSRQELFGACEYLCDEIYAIGDAVIPRDTYNAVHDAYRLAVRV